jgi:voltage-gated potassium channel
MKYSSPLLSVGAGIGILLLVMVAGVIGYRAIEGWTFIDALYMTVITLATVGYGETHPLSPAGRIFTIALILGGVGTAFYIISSMARYVLEGELGFRIGRQRMEAKISKLQNHYVLCGFGRVGEAIAATLKEQESDFVVIDRSEECAKKARDTGYLVIHDDAAGNDEVLKRARIDKAKALITALGEDADNTYAVLAARQLNPSLPIIARASSEEAQKRLHLAGASRVVAPNTIGGHRMAMLALRPQAVEFVETVMLGRGQELLIEEIEVGDSSPLVGTSIKEMQERYPGVVVLALKRDDGTLIATPEPNAVVPKASSLVAFGTLEQLQFIEGCCQQGKATPKKMAK